MSRRPEPGIFASTSLVVFASARRFTVVTATPGLAAALPAIKRTHAPAQRNRVIITCLVFSNSTAGTLGACARLGQQPCVAAIAIASIAITSVARQAPTRKALPARVIPVVGIRVLRRRRA